jgi:hypothetical protein
VIRRATRRTLEATATYSFKLRGKISSKSYYFDFTNNKKIREKFVKIQQVKKITNIQTKS